MSLAGENVFFFSFILERVKSGDSDFSKWRTLTIEKRDEIRSHSSFCWHPHTNPHTDTDTDGDGTEIKSLIVFLLHGSSWPWSSTSADGGGPGHVMDIWNVLRSSARTNGFLLPQGGRTSQDEMVLWLGLTNKWWLIGSRLNIRRNGMSFCCPWWLSDRE